MAFYFCSENCSFYDSSIFPEEQIPENVWELKEEDYLDLLSKQANGYLILVDEEGQPYAVKQNCKSCDCLQQVTFRGIFTEGDLNEFTKRGIYELNGDTSTSFTNIAKVSDCVGILEVYEVSEGELIEQRFTGIASYRRLYAKTINAWSSWIKLIETESGQVSSDEIADKAVTEGKIKDYAITRKKIAAYAVGKDEIEIEGIESQNLKPYCVTTEKIADNAITKEKLGEFSVQTKHIAQGAITTSRIIDDAVTTPKIVDGAVTSEKLSDDLTLKIIKLIGANKGNNNTTYILLDNSTVNGDLDVKYDAIVQGILKPNEIELPLFSRTAGLSRSNPRIRANEITGSQVGGMKIEVSFDEGETWYKLCSYANGQFTVGE